MKRRDLVWGRGSAPLSRRTFLRGVGGVAVGLPVLDRMLDVNGAALAATGAPLPARFLYAFGGCALGADRDPVHDLFVPDVYGPGYDLKRATAPLANHGNVQDRISLVTNLSIPWDTGSGIPPGGWSWDFHIQALGPLISGVRNASDSDYDVQGVTADQVVAAAIGAGTLFPVLAYIVQASWYLTQSAPYGRDTLSWYLDSRGRLKEQVPQASPKAAYDALFTGFVPPGDAEAQAYARDLLKRNSVVDLVRADTERLLPTLGRTDQTRMEQHLDHLRELERVLESTPPELTLTCYLPDDPGPDPAVGGSQPSTGGSNYDTSLGYSDEHLRAEVFAGLIQMAFACDLSRSVSLVYTMAQSHMSGWGLTGHPYDVHEVGHAGLGTEAVSDIVAWHVDLFGALVARLRDTPEGDGSLLDRCACVLQFEAGHGYDPGAGDDDSTHSTERMACLVAGGAGGLVQGEHLDGTGYHPVNVLNTLMHAIGVDHDLGEVVGEVAGLRR